MKNNKYRIIKITFCDNSERFEVQKKTWYGKWINCIYDFAGEMKLPVSFGTLEDAEKAYCCSFVDPVIEVVKEY